MIAGLTSKTSEGWPLLKFWLGRGGGRLEPLFWGNNCYIPKWAKKVDRWTLEPSSVLQTMWENNPFGGVFALCACSTHEDVDHGSGSSKEHDGHTFQWYVCLLSCRITLNKNYIVIVEYICSRDLLVGTERGFNGNTYIYDGEYVGVFTY